MDLATKQVRIENRNITILLAVPVAVIAKMIQFFVLPDKYFFDSWRMLDMLNGSKNMQAWETYETTVEFYDFINVFGFTTIRQWGTALGIIMTAIMICMISKCKEMSLRESVFTLMSVGLLNIYVFGITKEVIQIGFFFFIFLIICLPIKNTFIKVVGCALIFYWESTFYRSYYIIMAVMSIVIFFVMYRLKTSRRNINKWHVFLTIAFSFAMVFVLLYLSSFVMPEEYLYAINIRDESTITDANTLIVNPIVVNSNLQYFIIDYIVAAVRMMLPIELLVKSPVYLPFVIYQIFILYYYIKCLKNIKHMNDSMIVVVSCFSAYLLGSFIFEPDFGSWVRHESATFPILQMMAYYSGTSEKDEKEISDVKRVVVYETTNI